MRKSNPKTLTGQKLKIAGILLSISLTASMAAASSQTKSIPEILNLNIQENHASIPGLPKDKKKVNSFSHKKHAEIYLPGNSEYSTKYTDEFTCKACHQESANVEELLKSEPEQRLNIALTAAGTINVKNYFHDICLNCHKNMKKVSKPTGPTKCNDCHSRD